MSSVFATSYWICNIFRLTWSVVATSYWTCNIFALKLSIFSRCWLLLSGSVSGIFLMAEGATVAWLSFGHAVYRHYRMNTMKSSDELYVRPSGLAVPRSPRLYEILHVKNAYIYNIFLLKASPRPNPLDRGPWANSLKPWQCVQVLNCISLPVEKRIPRPCQESNKPATHDEWTGDGDPLATLSSVNAHRPFR